MTSLYKRVYKTILTPDRNLISKGYRFLVYKKYVIFYSVNKDIKTVYIHTINNYTKGLRRML